MESRESEGRKNRVSWEEKEGQVKGKKVKKVRVDRVGQVNGGEVREGKLGDKRQK